MDESLMRFFYGSAASRAILCLLLRLGLPKWMAAYLNSGFSKWLINRYIKKHHIDMDAYPNQTYRSFAEFFSRKKAEQNIDDDALHFLSPCDGWLSAYPIRSDSSFSIKGSEYRICDLIGDSRVADEFRDGICLLFRLSASDYHHYIFIDNGFVHENNYIEGELHSVQPIACDNYPVYRLNRRVWSVLDTENYGRIAQVEVGALAVGGIVNLKENAHFSKGEEMGHFELCGSTIALFITKDRIEILPEISETLLNCPEYRVTLGMHIGNKK